MWLEKIGDIPVTKNSMGEPSKPTNGRDRRASNCAG